MPAGERFAAELTDRLERAREAQRFWAEKSVAQRLSAVLALRKILSEEAAEVAGVIAAESGKTSLEALTQEVIPSLDSLLFLEKNAARILADRPVKLKTRQFYFRGKKNFFIYRPYGLIGILGTWNYAFYLSISQVVFALAAGNGVILKGASLSPKVTRRIQELLTQSGFPKDLFWGEAGGEEAGRALVEARLDKYILTGSRRTGRAVLKTLSDSITPLVSELSGLDSFVILPDADWDLAARTLVWAVFQYSGQTCVAPRRVLVLRRDAARFREAFGRAVKAAAPFVAGQGRLRTAELAKSEAAKLAGLEAQGARLEWSVAPLDAGEAGVISPRLYSGLRPQVLKDEEFMAPVIFLIECVDEAEILSAANTCSFALGASVWTRDPAKARILARKIRAGQVWVNDTIFSAALGEVPFGGFAQSGSGKTRGEDGLLEMVEKKWISEDWRKNRFLEHLPPYSKGTLGILLALQAVLYAPTFGAKAGALMRLVVCVTLRSRGDEGSRTKESVSDSSLRSE